MYELDYLDEEYYKATFDKEDLKVLLRSYKVDEEEAWQKYSAIRERVELLERLIAEPK